MQRNRAPHRVSDLTLCQRKRVQLTQALQRLGLRADGYCWCRERSERHELACDFARQALEEAGLLEAGGRDDGLPWE